SVCLVVIGLVLLVPLRSEAYAGSGAGFAVLSSFWTLFVAFLYSAYAFLTWPFRHLFRLLRHRKAYGKAQIKRAVILGFDGMDPGLASRFIAEGKLPNLAKLRDQGTFRKLRTTFPPISPVAWSTFMTGVNPGKHNIYDFLARDLNSYLPFLSSAEIRGPKRSVKIGKYTIPLGKPTIKGMRRGTPFWHWLGKAGIFCSVIRVPVTFPPEKFPGVLLSGMCVPDLKGSQATCCFCTTRSSGQKFREGGLRIPIERNGSALHSYIPVPEDPLAGGSGRGLAEDTWALNEEVLDDQAFLAQCYSNHDDRERMLFDALEKTRQGLCACVFDTTDRVQHMFWRYLEEDHPAARGIPRDQRPNV